MRKNKKIGVPGNHTLIPIVAQILQKFGGKAFKNQVVFSVMSCCNLPYEAYDKVKNETGWAGTYLRKIGFMSNDSKRGEWVLKNEYMNMSFDELKRLSYKRYAERSWII